MILVSYLTDSLPDATLNQFDCTCIFKLSEVRWHPWSQHGPLGSLLQRSMIAALSVLGLGFSANNDSESIKKAKRRRSKGLQRFVLALSDQQLVTGLGILIAGFSNRCNMPLYYFNIIASLAWFSSTTHLSTLAVLRPYLIEHPHLREWRVVVMLGALILLSIAQAIIQSPNDNSVLTQCGFENGGSRNALEIVSLAIVLMFLIVAYSDGIMRLYSIDPDWSTEDKLALLIYKIFRKRKHKENLIKIVIESLRIPKVEQGVLWRRIQEKERYAKARNRLKAAGNKSWKLALTQIVIVSREIQYSFMAVLLSLLFAVTYGVAQIIVYRQAKPSGGLTGAENTVSFGQLVPLLLMLLPVFAAVEVYFGKCRHDQNW